MTRQPTHRRERDVRRRTAVWLGGSAIGAGIVALPDRGPRLFSLSETHGPSAVDLVGTTVLVAAWLPVASLLWSRRRSMGGAWRRASAVVVGAGVLLLVVTIGLDLGSWWVLPVALLVAAQLLALRAVALSG